NVLQDNGVPWEENQGYSCHCPSKRAMRICLTLQFNISKASKLRFSNSIKNKNTANAEASKPLEDSFGQNSQCYSTVARLTLHSFL
ncbi:hypothetical protein Droror1_Dr00003960, partial [Drosera rotundifolia]